MVDFKKRLGKKKLSLPIKPLEIYSALDRESDKGPLRPVQETILEKWFTYHREDQDVILKLHTGQGKTLIGLLMLQSRLNELQEPVLYLCPNKFLAAQTCAQARQFGIKVCSTEGTLPTEFYNADAILVTHVQKLFNGKTLFGLRANSTSVSTLLVDDAHTCIDSIRAATKITLASTEPAYKKIRDLFSKSLKEQGMGYPTRTYVPGQLVRPSWCRTGTGTTSMKRSWRFFRSIRTRTRSCSFGPCFGTESPTVSA